MEQAAQQTKASATPMTPDMLERLFENAPHATLVLTPQLILIAANAAARRLFGSPVATLGTPLFSMLGPAAGNEDWLPRLRQSYADLLAGGQPASVLLPARTIMGAEGDEGADFSAMPASAAAPVASLWHVCHALMRDAAGSLMAIVTHAHVLDGVDIAVAPATAPVVHQEAAFRVAQDDAGTVNGDGAADTAARERLQILLVEDNEDLRLSTTAQLEHLGQQVTGVADAEQAMRLLEGGRFDMLFTDLTLPKMTGAELARTVLQREHAMQVVITSGYGRALANAQNLDALFLPKPYRLDDLVTVLDQVQSRRRRPADA